MAYPYDYMSHYYPRISPMLPSEDPYFYQVLQSLVGHHVVVQTSQRSVRGIITDVKPDHVTVNVHHTLFFIRTPQIVWVMPQAAFRQDDHQFQPAMTAET
ncbi:hypothetical protein GCM10010965_19500 [Caldalkalibacillus thermarum]|uniref:YuzF family protein n=1 Tax=Caldalkalibacillus thermarum TaxID=296745 RepID=UPI0019900612|nr:YuzF family protein [Caldalkalibacillus thermarum]GGK26860.1 hypothetical protein GCM10010965_19500 [Caldalkalibacillus thermarum]